MSDGWWRGQHGIVRAIDAYGSTTALLAQLHVTLADGRQLIFGTDASWRSSPSHILAADLICGETHDHRRRIPGWAEPGTDRSSWASVRVADHGLHHLCPTVGPPVRRVEELPAVSVTQIAPGRHVVDFGQNSNGWIRLHDLGPAGTEIHVAYGEWLDPDGNVTQANIAVAAFAAPRATPLPFQTDVVISAGDGAAFEPRHSTKGFQYVRLDGHPGPVDPASIVSVVVHTDLTPAGGFDCSDERINRLHRVAEWSFRGNACDIPTDCPTRERSGWVGDWQLYVATAAYLYDVGDFSAKWLADLAADQLESGAVTSIVPDPSPDAPIWRDGYGSSGWGGRGRARALGAASRHRPHRRARRPVRIDGPLGRLRRLTCRHRTPRKPPGGATGGGTPRDLPVGHRMALREWLEPGTNMDTVFAQSAVEDHGPVATAYLYRSADELARIAEILGHAEAATTYGQLAADVADAWRTEFLDADGRVKPHTQANLVRALAFGLVPEAGREQAASDLVALVREAGTHLGTGFLATPFLLPVLADHGHLDLAYELLFQETEPSWLHMSERTSTIWEDWDGCGPTAPPRTRSTTTARAR